MTDTNQLALTVTLGSVTFSGLLPANLPKGLLASPAAARLHHAHPSAAALPAAAAAAAAAAADSDSWPSAGDAPPYAASLALAREPAPDAGAFADEKHANAAAEYERLLISGPPPGAKCALCHGDGVDYVPPAGRGPGGRCGVGLGSLMLVKASTVSNAWVHDQCARWSPDVYDPT